VQEFIECLSGKSAQKVTWTLALLEELEILPSTYFKKLVNTDGIWESKSFPWIKHLSYLLFLCWQFGCDPNSWLGEENPENTT
jgi:hypothetical protein